MKTLIFCICAFASTILFSQKEKVELFETDRFKVPANFATLDLDKKFHTKVLKSDLSDTMTIFISNNEILLDSYMVKGSSFRGGIAIYEMDFVLKVKMIVKEPEGEEELFLDFNSNDGKTMSTLVYRDENRFQEHDVKVIDGFIIAKMKSKKSTHYKFSLLLNKFYSVKCALNYEKGNNEDYTLK